MNCRIGKTTNRQWSFLWSAHLNVVSVFSQYLYLWQKGMLLSVNPYWFFQCNHWKSNPTSSYGKKSPHVYHLRMQKFANQFIILKAISNRIRDWSTYLVTEMGLYFFWSQSILDRLHEGSSNVVHHVIGNGPPNDLHQNSLNLCAHHT